MDNFTYSDISGKRRLRNYVWAVIVIGVIVAGLFGYAAWQRSQVMAVANAQPQPLSVALAAPTEAPTATSLPPTPTTGTWSKSSPATITSASNPPAFMKGWSAQWRGTWRFA